MPGDGVITKHTHSRSMASWRSVNWIFWLSAWFWLLSSTSSFRRSRISDSRNMVLYSSSCFWDAANTTAAPSRRAAWPAAVSFFIFADICQNNSQKLSNRSSPNFWDWQSVTVDDLKLVFFDPSWDVAIATNVCLLYPHKWVPVIFGSSASLSLDEPGGLTLGFALHLVFI